jgi:hypothetical protein
MAVAPLDKRIDYTMPSRSPQPTPYATRPSQRGASRAHAARTPCRCGDMLQFADRGSMAAGCAHGLNNS